MARYRAKEAAEAEEARVAAAWKQVQDKNSGAFYYFNTITNATTWEKPPAGVVK